MPLPLHAEDKAEETLPKSGASAPSARSTAPTSSVLDLLFTKSAHEADEKFRALRRERQGLIKQVDEVKTQLSSLRDGLGRKEQSLQRLREQLDGSEIAGAVDSVSPSLRADRDNLAVEVSALKASLEKLSGQEREKGDQQLRQLSSRLDTLTGFINRREEDDKRRSQQIGDRRKKLEDQIRNLSDTIANDQKLAQTSVQEINDHLIRQSAIEDDLNDVLKIETQRNDFKTTIALFFAGLVALVIGGFFVLSYRDDVVRRAIFSSESGIQFLTLFSVVIAIILFGIIGILESKELAALLGGLSGYILGRVTSAPSNQQAPSAAPPPAPAPLPLPPPTPGPAAAAAAG